MNARDVANACRVLGLQPGAALAEARDAHRDLMKIWHPDRFENDPRLRTQALEKTKLINAALDVMKLAAQGAVVASAQPERSAPQTRPSALPKVLVAVAVFVALLIGSLEVLRRRIQVAKKPEPIAASLPAPLPTSLPIVVAALPTSLPASVPSIALPAEPSALQRYKKKAPPLHTLWAPLLKNPEALRDTEVCTDAYLFNAEERSKETVFQIWLTRGKAIRWDQNVFLSYKGGPTPGCVQDIRISACGKLAGTRTYRTELQERLSAPQIDVALIQCKGKLYRAASYPALQ